MDELITYTFVIYISLSFTKLFHFVLGSYGICIILVTVFIPDINNPLSPTFLLKHNPYIYTIYIYIYRKSHTKLKGKNV